MRIVDLLDPKSIQLNGSASGKQNALNKMVDLMAKSGKIKNGVISIDVFFNQGINPLSVKTSNIYINGEQLKESAGYMFSRNGNTLRLTFVAPEGDFSIKIENIESFKGDKLSPAEFTGINESSSVTIKPVSGDGGTKDDKNSHN